MLLLIFIGDLFEIYYLSPYVLCNLFQFEFPEVGQFDLDLAAGDGYQRDEMEFTVETSPNIGSRHEIGIHDGSYTVPISGMEYAAWYHWYVYITDGTHWTRKIYSFSTGYPSPFDPFDYGWQYRKQIIIDHTKVIGDQTEFPVLISVSDMDLIKTQQNGDDLLFMNGPGASIKVRHEIQTFNQATGSLTAWVNIPVLSSTQDTAVYLYYGNPDCINQEYPEKTWDPHYKAVWHMNDDTSSTITDSNVAPRHKQGAHDLKPAEHSGFPLIPIVTA